MQKRRTGHEGPMTSAVCVPSSRWRAGRVGSWQRTHHRTLHEQRVDFRPPRVTRNKREHDKIARRAPLGEGPKELPSKRVTSKTCYPNRCSYHSKASPPQTQSQKTQTQNTPLPPAPPIPQNEKLSPTHGCSRRCWAKEDPSAYSHRSPPPRFPPHARRLPNSAPCCKPARGVPAEAQTAERLCASVVV